MAGNRAELTKSILTDLAMLDPTPDKSNLKYYTELLAKMTAAQVEAFVDRLEKGEEFIQLKVPNFNHMGLSFEKLIAVTKKLGVKLYERVWLTDRATGVTYLTPGEHPILMLPVRSQTQSLMSKISVAPDNSTIDNMTGQPTGESKTSTLSFVEQQVLTTYGMKRSVEELIRVRGGNLEAFANFEKQFLDNAAASLDSPGMEEGVVKSIDTSSKLLFSMHIDNDLVNK